MEHQDNLFKEFEAISAEAWLAKITVDLKGKDREALNHRVGENISLSPFHHADTISESVGPIVRNTEGNQWLIGESFLLDEDLRLTNKAILHALENGVEAIKITVDRRLTAADFIKLFDQVEPSYIHTHFTISKKINPLELLSEFAKVLADKIGDKNAFYGSVDGMKIPDQAQQNWKNSHLPNFKIWCVEAPFGDPVDQLTTLIKSGINGLEKSDDFSVAAEVVFKMKIGTDFFLEIAKLRALRVLWANVLQSFGLEATIYPKIMVDFDTSSQTEDPNQNMIRATTMAMAAALGGADLLTVLPASEGEEDRSAFYRRIARNVQHILKMESFLDRVKDVAGGSYYLETLTTKIGEAVWKSIGDMN